jgi:alpha-L-fucosidase 2
MKILILSLMSLCSAVVLAQPVDSTEWAQYMQHTRLYWDSLGTDYYDGIIQGNGRLGLNMYREGERSIRFDVGRSDVTDQRPHFPDSMFTQQLISRPRLPIGRMVIRTAGVILSSSVVLDIYNAEARGQIVTSKGKIELHFMVPSGEEVIRIEATQLSGDEKLLCEWVGEQSISPRISFGRVDARTYGYVNNPDFVLKDSAGFGICHQPLLVKGEYATVWKHEILKAQHIEKHVIHIAVGYSPDIRGKAVAEGIAALSSFRSKPLDQVQMMHRRWWNGFFQQSFVSIPDKRVETYYWLQLYKLASATRANKPMIDLMGPWFTSKTPWPAIWWNLNQQLTYSPLFASNHLELTRPLFDQLNNNLQQLINNVPEPWRKDAAAIGRITGFDLAAPLNQHQLSRGQFEPGNLVWVMLYYYRYFQYSGDQAELNQKIYPLLKRAVNYLLHLLYKDEQGIYHLVRSHSPEFADAEDAHYSLAGLIWGLQTLTKLNDRFDWNDPDRNRWNEVLNNLTPLHANEKGFMVGRGVELNASHRHYSHLMAIYPYRLLDMDNPAHRKITHQSIEHWHSMPSALAGYSYTGAAAMYALLGEGDKSLRFLNSYLDRHGEPGGIYAESGPCFETPMAFATSLLEMMLQSDDGKIKIFPALPDEWKELSFGDLGAEGAFRVSAVRYAGQLSQVKIQSLAGNRCSLELLTDSAFDIISDKRGQVDALIQRKGKVVVYAFDTRKGETLTLQSRNGNKAKNLLVHYGPDEFKWGLNSQFLEKGKQPQRPFFLP